VQFGSYDWRVLDVRGDGTMLLLSERTLEYKQYHSGWDWLPEEEEQAEEEGQEQDQSRHWYWYWNQDWYWNQNWNYNWGWNWWGWGWNWNRGGDSNQDWRKEWKQERDGITWEFSEMRAYLNNEFYNSFGEAEQVRIVETTIANKSNPWFGTKGGNDTSDKVFLLSLEEVVRYFGDSGQLNHRANEARRIDDEYNSARAAYGQGDLALGGWWLRSPGDEIYKIALVRVDGSVNVAGHSIDDSLRIRPAMWVRY
jgi:hypothetical protein